MRTKSFRLKATLLTWILLANNASLFAQTTAQHNEAVRLNNRGVALVKEKNYTESLELFNRSLGIEKAEVVFSNRATAFFRLKRYKEALRDVESVLSRNADNVKGLALRAKIYEDQKIYSSAFTDFSHLLLLEPNEPLYALGRGNAAIKIKKYVEALDSYYYAVSLAQRGFVKDDDDANFLLNSVKSGAGDIYAVLGLPPSPFLKRAVTARTSPDVEKKARVGTGELRFDGICASVDSEKGILFMDVLSVCFPNGMTRVLPKPKRKQLRLSGTSFVNTLNPQFLRKPAKGDFLVAVGKDNGKLVSPRLIAIGTPNFTGIEPNVNFAAVGRPRFVLENRSYQAGTAFFVANNNDRYMVCAWHLLHNDDSLPDKGAKQTLDALKEVQVDAYAGSNTTVSREVTTREGFGMGEKGNDLTGDYFVMKATGDVPTLPISAETPIQYQSVWVAGQTVNERQAKLYKAYVAKSDDKMLILLMDDKQNFKINAMSGAPILDTSGGVVGILLGGTVLETKTTRIYAAPVSALQHRFENLNQLAQ